MTNTIRSRDGREFEITRGPKPERDFNIGVGELGKRIAERVRERELADPSKCCHDHHDDVLREIGVDSTLVAQSDEGQARVYSMKNGVITLALERPSAIFYQRQADSAAADIASTQTLKTSVEAHRTALRDAIQSETTLQGLQTKLIALQVDEDVVNSLENLTEAQAYAGSLVIEDTKFIKMLSTQLNNLAASRDWNLKATQVADGFRCVCYVSRKVKELR